jgi:hypothetical protein
VLPGVLVRHGLEPGDEATGPADRLVDESPVLAGIVGASVQGRVALGQRAGARVRRLGDARDTEAVTSRGPRQAHLEGFDLHANVWVSGSDRAGRERLCRYILLPPFAQERLRRRSDGRIALELKTASHDGTRELVFEPLEFLERLAAMMPRPETNLLICHGLLAARARWRARVVAYGRVAPEPTALAPPLVAGAEGTKAKTGSPAWTWAASALMSTTRPPRGAHRGLAGRGGRVLPLKERGILFSRSSSVVPLRAREIP